MILRPKDQGALSYCVLALVVMLGAAVIFLLCTSSAGCAHTTTVTPGRSEASVTLDDKHAPQTEVTRTVIRVTPCAPDSPPTSSSSPRPSSSPSSSAGSTSGPAPHPR